MDLFVSDADRRRRLTATIYAQLRDAIATGRVRPRDRLPSSRALATELDVSRHTITTVYGRLVAEGYLEGAAGGGTRVAVDPFPSVPDSDEPRVELRMRPSLQRLAPVALGGGGPFDLRLGTPDPRFFPADDWRRRMTRELRAVGVDGSRAAGPHAEVAAGYRDPAGEPVLRAAIAAWIERSRGVRATAERVIVTAGAQQGFDLVLTALIEPGDVVAVEDPGYPRFRDLARLRGAEVIGVPVDAEGLVVDALPDEARLVHVTPSHQFPLGSVMSLSRRRALLRWARAHDAAVIEDDYDSEFRFTGRPLEPLHLLDDDGRVIYVATFSKTLSPELRLGFLVAPGSLVAGLGALRQLLDWHGEPVAQRALAGFLVDGAMARHVHRARRLYAARRDVVLRHGAGDLRRLGPLVPAAAGIHVALELRGDMDEADVLARARTAGVEIDGLTSYAVSTVRPGLAISYGTTAPDRLDEALTRLARC
jgi:GntR family transcriptional regulator/MocR family aminotransferase